MNVWDYSWAVDFHNFNTTSWIFAYIAKTTSVIMHSSGENGTKMQ